MIEFLLAEHMVPFSIALALLFGLMALELVAALLGGSILGAGGDADMDIDADFDLDADFDIDASAEFEADFDADIDPEIDVADADTSAGGGLAGMLGMGKVPFLIWLGSFLLAFGLGGFVLQSVLDSIIGLTLPASLAAGIMVPVGLGFARGFSEVFARLLPKSESTALSENHLGRTRGVVTTGVAKRGNPAQVRVQDRHGNTHYLRAEPMRDEEEIPQGTEVLVLRKGRDTSYRIVAIQG
jgi:hypothetical protein